MASAIGIWLMAHGSVAVCADMTTMTIHVTHPRRDARDLHQAMALAREMGYRTFRVRDVSDGVLVIDVRVR